MDTALGRGSWRPEWPPVKGLLAFGGQEEGSPQTAAGTTGSQLVTLGRWPPSGNAVTSSLSCTKNRRFQKSVHIIF